MAQDTKWWKGVNIIHTHHWRNIFGADGRPLQQGIYRYPFQK